MVRLATVVGALVLLPSLAAAQQPCTGDGRRVVDEVYRLVLERPANGEGADLVQRLENGDTTVREIVRDVAKSQEHMRRFMPGRNYEQAATYLYRHVLGRQGDADGIRAHAEGIRTQGPAAAIDSMIASPEYQQQFGADTVPGANRLRFCQGGGGFQSGNRDSSFRSLDRNGNGVITRDEWQGTRLTFNSLDRDGDGVLSRAEVGVSNQQDDASVGNRRDRRDRFEALDANNDNRVDRREWDGRDDEFDLLDRNNNGVLSRGEVVGNRAQGRDQFSNLDVNGDGRLTFDEWNWSRRSFDDQDVNRDGALTRREFVSSGAVGTTGR